MDMFPCFEIYVPPLAVCFPLRTLRAYCELHKPIYLCATYITASFSGLLTFCVICYGRILSLLVPLVCRRRTPSTLLVLSVC